MRLLRCKPRSAYANVVATLALFLAVGGGAFATAKTAFVSQSQSRSVRLCVDRDRSVTVAKSGKRCGRGSRTIVLDRKGRTGRVGPAGPQGPAGPSTGPAGGDLADSYPNPSIGAGKVTTGKLGAGAVATTNLQDGAVRARTLGPITTVSSNFRGHGIVNSQASVQCPSGTTVISGGFQSGVIGAITVTGSLRQGNGWALQGFIGGTNDVTVTVFAYCLRA